jgi:hypothetical protein
MQVVSKGPQAAEEVPEEHCERQAGGDRPKLGKAIADKLGPRVRLGRRHPGALT